MPILSVRTDFRRFSETLDDLQRKQLPYATALAITATARAARSALTRDIPSIFSQKGAPTPFTRRAIGMTAARKNNLRAEIFVKRVQAKYLGIQEEGGSVARAPGAPILTPVNATLNGYGNIPRGMVKKLLADPKRYFLGRVRGTFGVWERTQTDGALKQATPRGLRLIVALRERAHYRPRFGFHKHIARTVATTFLPALSAGMAHAMATAIRR